LYRINFIHLHTVSFLGGCHRNASITVGLTNTIVETFTFVLFTFLAAFTVEHHHHHTD